jgi:hypothetical protein
VGYTTVQAAVNAASSGGTVYLCGTTPYDGQVIITKSTKPGSVDFGSHDVVIYNDISGAGYANHPACTTTQPYSTDKSRHDRTGRPPRVVQLLTGAYPVLTGATGPVTTGRPGTLHSPGRTAHVRREFHQRRR